MRYQTNLKGNAIFFTLILGMALGIGSGCGSSMYGPMPTPVDNTATATFYGGSFALDDIVLPSDNGMNSGTVTITGTATTIAYVLNYPAQNGVAAETIILQLDGDFSIPAASIAAGNVNGTTGTVTAVSQSFNGQLIFQISNLRADAGNLTLAWNADNEIAFWGYIANGAADIQAATQGATTNLYCTQAGEGTAGDNFIAITGMMSVSIQVFVLTC
ncbi:MAG TPA: hypothetical protein VF848_03680 [Steroidobacteraceae bacterium]